jgi:hypothetical protein
MSSSEVCTSSILSNKRGGRSSDLGWDISANADDATEEEWDELGNENLDSF